MFNAWLLYPIKIIYRLYMIANQYRLDCVASFKNNENDICKNFWMKGFYIFENLIDKNKITKMLLEFEALQKNIIVENQGQSNGRIFSYGPLSPIIEEFADNLIPLIKKLLNTNNVNVEISYYQSSKPEKFLDDIPGGDFHVDDSKANVKFFIYLTDVGNNNGPFALVPGTGGWKLRWSLLRGFLWDITGERKFLYNLLVDAYECEKNEITITGPQGTCFLVDATSLHRGLPVKLGERKVAVISFNRRQTFLNLW
jgi:hypothetical protein